MSSPSETHSDTRSNLGDSTYEFIDTDEESRDDNATESTASTDYGGRPEDMESLADTEHSEDESEEGIQHAGGIPAFTGLDGPEDTPTLGQSAAVFYDDVDRPVIHSIAFDEPPDLGEENVSVMHTVVEFKEHETAAIADSINLHRRPQRLLATIRQTMTKQGLSTREPLRILYVGSHSAKREIIHKIGSSVAASAQHGDTRYSPSQFFNVVPVTAFGSEKAPEIEMVESSEYQIKVDDCTTAVNMKFKDEPEKPDVLKLTLDDSLFSYHSVPEGNGFAIEPAWELPHVAIIYSSDSDTLQMVRTRTFAKTFMNRHKVPVIFISHKQLFDKYFGYMTLDQHPIHMCLESRDPSGPRNIIHQRLPIDLASFMNIDARQMNRNIAYITGLHEPLESSKPVLQSKSKPMATSSDIEKTSYSLSESYYFIRNRTGAEWRALLPVGSLLLSVVVAAVMGMYFLAPNKGYLSINGNLTSTGPICSTSSILPPSEILTSASLRTSTETRTSTKTITVIHANSPIPNSLSVVPSMDVGKPSDKIPVTKPSAVCVAEILGDREVLIRIPSATKLSWLANEAMSINVTRSNNETVMLDRVYTTDDGIILQLAKKEAYGMVNISVVTTKKPKINEKFSVDFGSNPQHEFLTSWEKIGAQIYQQIQLGHAVNDYADAALRRLLQQVGVQTKSFSELTRQRVREARLAAKIQAIEKTAQLKELATVVSTDLIIRSAILSKELSIQAASANKKLKELRGSVDDAIMHAQIQSKLFWLEFLGRTEERNAYAQRASKRHQETAKMKRRAEEKAKKVQRAADKAARKARKFGKKSG